MGAACFLVFSIFWTTKIVPLSCFGTLALDFKYFSIFQNVLECRTSKPLTTPLSFLLWCYYDDTSAKIHVNQQVFREGDIVVHFLTRYIFCPWKGGESYPRITGAHFLFLKGLRFRVSFPHLCKKKCQFRWIRFRWIKWTSPHSQKPQLAIKKVNGRLPVIAVKEWERGSPHRIRAGARHSK